MTAEEYLNSSLGTSEKVASADDFLNEQLGSSTEEPEPSGFLRQAADLPVQFAKGGLQGTRMFTDLLGAGNPISKKIAGGEDYLDALLSAESKKDSEESARILKAAEDKGVYDQVVAGLEALSKAPLETAFNVAGIAVPNLALGALGKAAQAGKAAITATQVGLGALQGAGSIKGQIYQAVQDELRSQGMDEETIHKTASEAQAYGGKNLDQILLGAGLGAAATRAEVILSRVISGAGKEVTDDVIKNTFKNGLFEAIPETFQGGQEQIAQNKALQNIGVDVPTMRGVVSASTMEGVAGGAFGGVAGLTESMSATPQSISTKRNASPEAKAEAEIDRDSDIQAAKLSIPANDTNKNLILDRVQQARQGIVNLQESLDVLEPTDPKAQGLRLDISAKQKELASLEAMAGLSEPITEANRQQAELAKAIVEEAPAAEPAVAPAGTAALPAPRKPERAVAFESWAQENRPEAWAELQRIKDAERNGQRMATPSFQLENKIRRDYEEAVTPTTAPKQDTLDIDTIAGIRSGIASADPDVRELWAMNLRRKLDKKGSLTWEDIPQDLSNSMDTFAFGALKNAIKINPQEAIDIIEGKQAPKPAPTEPLPVPPAPVEQVVTPPVGVAPTIVETAPVEPITPAPVTEQAAPAEAPAPEVAPIAGDIQVANEPKAQQTISATSEAISKKEPLPQTRGKGTQYHGARGPIENLVEAYYSPDNIYAGEGTFYTTDALDIAAGYQRKKQSGVIYRVNEVAPVNFFNMEERKPKTEWLSMFEGQGDFFEFAVEGINNDAPNLREIMDEMRAESANEGLTKDDVQEIFGSITYNLQKQGYGGMNHIGGLKTNREPHTVKIYFDPTNQISLSLEDVTKPSQKPTAPTPAVSETITEPAAAPESKISKIKREWVDYLAESKNKKQRSDRVGIIWNSKSSLDPDEREAAEQFFKERLHITEEERKQEAEVTEPAQPAKPKVKAKQKIKPQAPVLDPIGYGNALIDLFPTLKSAGVKAISMEESLARLEREWEKKQKSGKAKVIDKLVYLANKKNTESALAGGEIGGTWSRSDLTVAVSSKATPSAMSHEIGHAIMELEFAKADQKTKDEIIAEYNKWFASKYGKNGVPSVADQRRIWEWMQESDWLDPKAPFPQEKRVASWEQYRSSFKEWFADEVAKWATTNAKPKSLIEKFFTELAAKLNKLWNAVSENFAPNETLATWLDSITDVSPSKVEFAPKGDKIELLEATPEPSKTTRRTRIMGVEAGEEVETQEAIIARTKDLLRKRFDPTKVTEKNTTEAFRALGKLAGNRKEALAYAEELNDIGRLVDESGAASEISMGAALFVNDLFEYSIRLAAEGDSKMLGIMMANINRLPTAMIGASDAGRTLAARAELKARFSMMGRAEQDAYTNYVAEFIYGPNPTKEQIQSIKDAYAAVDKTAPVTEQELTDELESVGGRTGTDLVGKINDEFTKATEKGKEKRRTEEQELDKEYKKIQKQADAEIEKLAKIQSDTPSFDLAVRQIINEVRAIVANDLKQRPDMESKADWKSALIAKLQQVGVEPAAAGILADIVWRQHEINSLSRELSSINKAIEKGPISEIVKAIKDTPLEDQQKPNWRYEVMRDYLRKAGLPLAQAERIAKLMDISLQKRFTMAQEQAFTDAISKSAPWKSGDTRSRRAFQKVLQALRAGALDPARNVLSDMAALNGWTGFTPEQYKALLKNDAILSDPESADATKAEAHKAIQDIISKAKLPIRARDVIGQFYDAQALSGIPTMTVNIFSPAGMAVKNALTQSLNGLLTARPEQITASLTTFIDSIKSWANTVAFSFKNNVTVYSNVEYLVNDEGLLKLYKRGVDQFNKGKTPRERADGVKNMMIGMMDYVRRVLNALDYGAIASLQNQAVSKYALAAMQAKGMSSKDGAKMLNAMMEQKRIFYNEQIAIGTDKTKAAVLADEFFISSWRQALTDAKLPAQQVMDAALNDAMSAVGRNRQSLDAFREEETNTRDGGVISYPALWLLETMANAANKADNQVVKLFSRMIYGFAVVPARVFRETAWFSPYGGVRFAYDYIAKKMGKTSPYAQSLGNDLQYRQRLTETITGSIVLLGFAAAMSSSTEDEEDEKPFKIVVTGNGPLRSEDPQYYDSWTKKHKANTVSVYFGKTKFTINTMRGFEAFAWPAMMLGAVDDWQIRRKQKRETNTPMQMGDAAIIGGFVLSASLRRGPYSFAAKPLFEAYGDRGVESLAKSLAFPAKTLVPVLGASLARNLSDFLNEPVDRKTLEGALWSNVPFIGPAVSPKSLNAFGEPALANEAADKIFKLGVPITFNIPTDRDSVNLHELVLKQGGGPSIPTRNQLAQRLDRQPTNKEYEMFVKEYGAKISSDMKRRYEELSNKTPEKYSKSVEKIGNRARDIAERKVREAAKKP